MYKTELF